MLALMVCEDGECRAAFEAEGAANQIAALRCEDCDAPLRAMGWADADPSAGDHRDGPEVRRDA